MKQESFASTLLFDVEARLRYLLPAKMYADVWLEPSKENLEKVFYHLKDLHRILTNYLPREVLSTRPKPGEVQYDWIEGTLMFTDLAGFTPLLENNSKYGKDGAEKLLSVLNSYFSDMLEIVGKSGGNLLEFTGDALLVQFPPSVTRRSRKQPDDAVRAIKAGLRMQHAMGKYSEVKTMGDVFSIRMRIGLHAGDFLAADIGTPHRMEHVLLGQSVLDAKLAESKGEEKQVCVTDKARERAADNFVYYPGVAPGYSLVEDIPDEILGDYDILASGGKYPGIIQTDKSSREGLIKDIIDAIQTIEPLASFFPRPILNLLVENAGERRIPPDFPEAAVVFVNLLGLPKKLNRDNPEVTAVLVPVFSRAISLINAEIEAQGGVMKKVTYHLNGPDIMAFFGVPNSHTNDAVRAANAALGIKGIVHDVNKQLSSGSAYNLDCHIGINWGRVFAAEIGDIRGRREFNVLGNAVNTAARLMGYAVQESKRPNKKVSIIISEEVNEQITSHFSTVHYDDVFLKGRSQSVSLYELLA